MVFGAIEWRIEDSAGRCTRCGAEIPDQVGYFSTISYEDVGETVGLFRRSDYCEGCWRAQQPAQPVYAFWKTRRAMEVKERPPGLDPEVALDLFRRLEGPDPGGKAKIRFVLALLLVRKKRLLYRSSDMESGQEVLVLETREGEAFRVRNPGIADEEMASLKEVLGRLLMSGGEDLELAGEDAVPGAPSGGPESGP